MGGGPEYNTSQEEEGERLDILDFSWFHHKLWILDWR
jgi:hypothetical protein